MRRLGHTTLVEPTLGFAELMNVLIKFGKSFENLVSKLEESKIDEIILILIL